jgi:membrane fusion protein (multidrug efflux system)
MFARVNTVFGVNDAAVVVPEEAIVPQGGRQFVIKVVAPAELPATSTANLPADTKFVSLRQEVKLGVRRQGKVEILEGLTQGQTVVVAGQQRLQRDGSPLRIVEVGRPVQGPLAPASGASAPALAASR